MGNGEGVYRDLVPTRAQRSADRVVIREAIDEGHEAANLAERLAPKCQRRAEARARQAERQAEHHARQKVSIDGERGEACPDATHCNDVVEAGQAVAGEVLQFWSEAG